jgi:transcriptional regulator with XRE-family HTH domain
MPKNIDPSRKSSQQYEHHSARKKKPERYNHPSSPFQILIFNAIKKCGQSQRKISEDLGVSQGTVWEWLHNANGHPGKRSWDPNHAKKLAGILKIEESEILQAFDQSRLLYQKQLAPAPPSTVDLFSDFIQLLESMSGTRVDRRLIIRTAKGMKAQAEASEERQ